MPAQGLDTLSASKAATVWHELAPLQKVASVARQLWCGAMAQERWYDETAAVDLLSKCWQIARELVNDDDSEATMLRKASQTLQARRGEPPLPF